MRFFKKKDEPASTAQAVPSTPDSGAVSNASFSEKPEATETTHTADAPSRNASTGARDTELEPYEKPAIVGAAAAASPIPDPAELEAEDEDETQYPKSTTLALITVALCLSVFCVAIDNTIIATAIPKITDQFHAINDVGWYGSAYLLTTCAFQLFFGKLYTFFSIKWVYLSALLVFEIGSAVCGAAPNSTALIIGRAVAGLGSAGIFSGAILIIANTVPLRSRAAYTGIIGAMYGIASVAGPLMGGAFTSSSATWRWCFYINLPLGAVTILFIFFSYKPQASAKTLGASWKEKLEQFDIFGTLVFLPMVICLLLALQWGGSKYAWSDGRIIALFVVFGLLLAAFTAIQFWKQDNGTVPPRIIKQRSVAASAWFSVTIGSAFFVLIYYVPLWFQAIKGKSPVESGIANIPMVLGLVIVSVIAGGLVTWLGYYAPFMIAASVFASIGAGLISTWNVDTPTAQWIGYQIIFGVGMGFGMQQTLIAVQTVLPKADVPIGTALVMFTQTFGGSIFVSVAQNVFTNSLLKNVQATVPGIDPQVVLGSGATNLVANIPAQYLEGVLVAYNHALQSTFQVAAATASLTIIGSLAIEWRSVKGKKIEMAAA